MRIIDKQFKALNYYLKVKFITKKKKNLRKKKKS